ncbi:MAG: PadR family transcriptional regulator [Candidatus Bathyarchaeota archaeon]|nr:PadR family transcriptional regulator [Candidatus Bathyarchaeum tardum]
MIAPLELKKMLDMEIEKFRKKGATSPQKAMSLDDLELSVKFRQFINHSPRLFGVFVKVDDKYYLSEEKLLKIEEQLSSRPFARLLKHTASVPKGLLRVYVFKLLKEKPMSGSEIMDEVEKQTGGQWKPSPGSIYPLLTWLRETGYAQELPRESTGVKRYVLTEKGNQFFEEHSDFKDKLQQKMAPMGALFFLRMGLHVDGLQDLQEPIRRFFDALFELRSTLMENLTEETLTEARLVLNEVSCKIEKLTEKLKGDE